MPRHGVGNNLVEMTAEEFLLHPSQKETAAARAEEIEHHHHGPQSESGWENKVFGLCHHNAILDLGLYTITLGVILEQEFYPSCPEQQTTEKTEKRLPCVALDKNAHDDNHQSGKSHQEGGLVYGSGCHGVVHKDHDGMAQWHGEKHHEKTQQSAGPIVLLFYVSCFSHFLYIR